MKSNKTKPTTAQVKRSQEIRMGGNPFVEEPLVNPEKYGLPADFGKSKETQS